MSYVYANNDFQGGTLLNRADFKNVYPFVYFDLTKQKIDIKDGVTKLAFHYELEDVTNNDYFIYALVLHEREAKIEQQGGKLLLQALYNYKNKMKSFRYSNDIDRYEDVIFNHQESLDVAPANNNYQNRFMLKFIVNKEFTSLDWYNARLLMDFKVTKLNGNRVLVNDNNRIINGSNSFVTLIIV